MGKAKLITELERELTEEQAQRTDRKARDRQKLQERSRERPRYTQD